MPDSTLIVYSIREQSCLKNAAEIYVSNANLQV